MTRTALLLIDLQEDYLGRPMLEPARETLVANIAAALAEARQNGEPVFHIRTLVAADGADAMPHRQGSPEVVEGTPGALPPPELAERAGEPVLTKRFFSAFDAPGLTEALARTGVGRLRLAGVHAHACIHATALDAYARGLEVEIDEALVASDSPSHAAEALSWIDGRAASVVRSDAPGPWLHRDPCNQDRILGEIALSSAADVRAAAESLSLPAITVDERAARLRSWSAALDASRDKWVDEIVQSVGKPRSDAEGEVAYGLALIDHVAATLEDEENDAFRSVRYRPIGRVGLITPWNNPFAIPLGKLAPALGFGNAILWKPALPGSRIAALLGDSLEEAGFGGNLSLITGGAETGKAVLETAALSALSFTGSVPVGRKIIAAAGRLALPVQAELGGSNAAIVDASADLDAAASDLAAAMFSFAGQRCTAVRRVIAIESIADSFTERLVAEIAALRIGLPSEQSTQVGPVIDRNSQRSFLALAADCERLVGGRAPPDLPEAGCWMEPTLLARLADGHPLLEREIFGPVAAIQVARDLGHAIALHNRTDFGLVGALFTEDPQAERSFLDLAEAGMLSINRARPPFSAAGPFIGWKSSGFGPAEHGRWNREVYSRPQALYRRD